MCYGPQTLKTPQCMGHQEQAKLNSTFSLNTGSAVSPAGAGWRRPLARSARELGLDKLRVCFLGCSGWPGKLISWHSALELTWLCVLVSHCSQISPSWSTGSLADAAAVPEAGEEACGAPAPRQPGPPGAAYLHHGPVPTSSDCFSFSRSTVALLP